MKIWNVRFLKRRLKGRCGIVALIKLLGRMLLRSAFIVGIGRCCQMVLSTRDDSERRQILDGPFILNELIQLCKKKKKQAMIFKVDFKKAYDSVRWDFVDDILKKFGFGEKWCLFKGMNVASSLYISHLFYVDDAIFMGQWNQSNIDTITRVLEVFHRASGLRINMNKRSRVGGLMSRIQSWNDIIESMVSRLSRWKLKTLSIGGRLTLLKSVLGTIPIYHMSIFKVSMKVLQNMESIRPRFFNGADINSKKPSWVRWKNVTATKDTGGLGVSSLFALNIALMSKWVWWFISQQSSLWASLIKALHVEDGKIGKKKKTSYPSIWLSIIHEVELLKSQGIDLPSFIILKLGNGVHTSFWDTKSDGWSRAGQLELLKENIEGCILSNMNDRWAWSLEGSGEFSVSSVRKVIDATLLPKGTTKTRWIKAVPIKINVHAWKFKHDCLPTRVNISRRGMKIESMLCTMCDNVVESSRHLFFSCHFISELMRKITRWWDMDYMEINSFEE
uniref:RNA-directed DNA polymerase, eukaryota, reverse transcriptase zinc-binding domain protein n=1 Tax=Tanacetum cinerariifolium TaxID=118510 RepID=A0A699H7G5_TANCI|nr:RNA-directed DNA polymerase, eukaryota, reverse transcriptase zinc-binding domain protein [Tanacetum cinerariifolium]